MSKRIDLTGRRFGRLVAIDMIGRAVNSAELMWRCRCDCGGEKIVQGVDLRWGHTRSCGCLQAEKRASGNKIHGQSKTGTYKSWQNMHARCSPTSDKWQFYGGRGIKVCERWNDFQNFFADMGVKPTGMTIERTNNNGDYEPDNCRWATWNEQKRNKSTTVNITLNGQTKCLSDWARELGVSRAKVRSGIKKAGQAETV